MNAADEKEGLSKKSPSWEALWRPDETELSWAYRVVIWEEANANTAKDTGCQEPAALAAVSPAHTHRMLGHSWALGKE